MVTKTNQKIKIKKVVTKKLKIEIKKVVTMASDDKLRLYSTGTSAPSLQPVAQVFLFHLLDGRM